VHANSLAGEKPQAKALVKCLRLHGKKDEIWPTVHLKIPRCVLEIVPVLAVNRRLKPKIRDTIFVHANSSGWSGDLQPFLCLGASAAGAL